MAEYYSIDHLEIMREDISISIFDNLFKWMMLKNYTTYNISISGGKEKP